MTLLTHTEPGCSIKVLLDLQRKSLAFSMNGKQLGLEMYGVEVMLLSVCYFPISPHHCPRAEQVQIYFVFSIAQLRNRNSSSILLSENQMSGCPSNLTLNIRFQGPVIPCISVTRTATCRVTLCDYWRA